MKYLHEVSSGMFYLDHRLTPEVAAMLCAMASRAPVGGIKARYGQLVDAIVEDEWDVIPYFDQGDYDEKVFKAECVPRAEDRLCEYPLHPKVKKFFDDFVGKYGHSSIMELTGQPAVYTEGISWLTAWLLFDSPLCAGQEFSTRAVQHKDWPMARECFDRVLIGELVTKDTVLPGSISEQPHHDLVALHNDWFEVFEAEVAWWKAEFTSECPSCHGQSVGSPLFTPEERVKAGYGQCACQGTGKKYPTADKEPFRPALDRARWALPGTIATGCAHTSPLRERARVIRDGSLLAQYSKASSTETVWKDLAKAYQEALPGLAGMGLKEAVYGDESQIPGHLATLFSSSEDGPDAEVECSYTDGLSDVRPFARTREKTYMDPLANTVYHVDVGFRCSLAVARDWHRHRTMYPWHLQVVRAQHLTAFPGPIQIDPHYEPKSDLAKARSPELIERSTRVFDAFMADRNLVQAGLALPLGTRVRIRGHGGLRDAVYMIELRKYAHGANFEYQDQATQALSLLQDQLRNSYLPYGDGDEDIVVTEVFGLQRRDEKSNG